MAEQRLDLVVRLRKACFCAEVSKTATCKLCEAADEIDRLRKREDQARCARCGCSIFLVDGEFASE